MNHISEPISERIGSYIHGVPPEEMERRVELMRQGFKNAERKEKKRAAYIKVKHGWRMRKEGEI